MHARASKLSNIMENKQNTDIDTAQLQVFLNNALRAMGSLALALDQLNNLLPARERSASATRDYMRSKRIAGHVYTRRGA